MRLVAFALLAACSSPAPARPVDDGRAPIDAAPAIARTVPPDAAPEDEPDCLPAEAYIAYQAGGRVLACLPEDEDGDFCYAITADGVVAELADYFEPEYEPAFGDVEVYPCKDCPTVTPKLGKGQLVVAATVAERGRVALVMHDGKRGKAAVEVWDAKAATRIARAELADKDKQGLAYDVALVGDGVLVETTFVSSAARLEMLWKVAGTKLVKVATVGGEVDDAFTLDATRAMLVVDRAIVIVDVATGKQIGAVDWHTVVDPAAQGEVVEGAQAIELDAAEAPGQAVISVYASDDGALLGFGVADADGTFTRNPAPRCTLEP